MRSNKRECLVSSLVYFLWLVWSLFCIAWGSLTQLYSLDVIFCAWIAGVLLIGGFGYYLDGGS